MRTASSCYMQNQILSGPSHVLFTLLIFILSKNLHATPFELLVIAWMKPITSLVSFYMGSILHGRSHLIRPYLIFNIFLGALPCLFYPFIDNVSFYIGSYAIHMITQRAQTPAWCELLKSSTDLPKMSKIISRGTSIYYFISMFLPPIVSCWLENESWKTLFVLVSLLQFVNIIPLIFMKYTPRLSEFPAELQSVNKSPQHLLEEVFAPIKKGLRLLRQNPAFSHYLFLYFLGGAGIVLMQPILPVFFKDYLDISFKELTLAFSLCKGLSFLASSPIWAKYVTHVTLYRLNAYMNIFTSLFMAGLLASLFGVEWLYVGYLCYGTMQAGSELSWNMSGPIFSNKEDSTAFSSLNLLLVGVRGCICPLFGYLICTYAGVIAVFITTICLCLIGAIYGFWLDAKFSLVNNRVAKA
jgi:hypothetical protein